MEDTLGALNNSGQQQDSNQSPDLGNAAKRTEEYAKKIAIKTARWLFNFIKGGPLALGWLIATVVLIFVFAIIIFGLMNIIPGSTPKFSQTTIVETIPGLTLKLTGPAKIKEGEEIKYTVEVNYTGTTPPLSDIIVYETLPSNTEFIEATGAYSVENNEIVWPMNQNSTKFTFTLKPTTVGYVKIPNTVYARLAAGAAGSKTTPGAGAAATNNSCGGKYELASTPVGANFGDPECKFTKDDLYNLIKQVDPDNADKWYFKIVPCESGFNPNAYNGAAVDAGGAYGLYQMGRGKNGEFDHGDVDWATQTSNAVTYNKDLIGGSFAYWGCK